MIFTLKSEKTKMLEIAQSQLREWLPNVRPDVLDSVISSITQHIKKGNEFKKGSSLTIRFDQHPPKWLREIYTREHFDYAHEVSGIRQIHLDFNELTVHSQSLPEEPKIIYEGSRKKVPC